MTGKPKPFVYRESVRSYLESPEVRHAVNLLLDRKIGYMPEAFTAKQITDFYKACLAARQTQIEFVQDMVDMWHQVWPALGGDWQPVPHDPAVDDLSLDPVVRWSEGYFERRFELKPRGIRADMWLYLGSNEATTSDVELGCGLWSGSRPLFKSGSKPLGWIWDKDDKVFRYTHDEAVYRDGLDLSLFRKAALAAVRLIKSTAAQ